jgi:predicted phosphodiesterase
MSLKDRSAGPPSKHPKGWEPGVLWNGDNGEVSSGPLEDQPDDALWQEIVQDFGVTGSVRIVPGSIQVRAWETHDGRKLRYYRARLEPASIDDESRADIEELCKMVARRRPLADPNPGSGGDRALVVTLSDWQVGKAGEVGGGTPEFTERLLATYDRLIVHAKKMRKDYKIDTVVCVGLGDLIENCSGHYAAQTFSVDLDRREQVRLVRHLILELVEQLTRAGFKIVLGAIPGNHGENRSGNKAFTNVFTDNDDLAVVEQVAEILAHNPERYGNVFVPTGAIAEDHTMTLDVCGVAVGFAHGHQMRANQAPLWWMKQAHGRQPIGDAQILCSAHYHHFQASESSGRTHFQSPAMDGGSRWWTAMSGASAPSGMLTFLAGKGCGVRGWSNLAIL